MCSLLPPLTMSCDLPQMCLKDHAGCLKSLWHYLCPVSSEKLHTCQSRSGVPHLKCLRLQAFQTLWPSDLGLFPTLYQRSMHSVECVIWKAPNSKHLCGTLWLKNFEPFLVFGFLNQECPNYVPFPFSSIFSFVLLLVLKKIMSISLKSGPSKIVIPAFYLHLSLIEKRIRRPRQPLSQHEGCALLCDCSLLLRVFFLVNDLEVHPLAWSVHCLILI